MGPGLAGFQGRKNSGLGRHRHRGPWNRRRRDYAAVDFDFLLTPRITFTESGARSGQPGRGGHQFHHGRRPGCFQSPRTLHQAFHPESGNRKASSARPDHPTQGGGQNRPSRGFKQGKGSPVTEETAPKDEADARWGRRSPAKAGVEKTPPRRTKGMLKAAAENPSCPEVVVLQGAAVSVAEPIVPQRSVRFAEIVIRPQSADSNHF